MSCEINKNLNNMTDDFYIGQFFFSIALFYVWATIFTTFKDYLNIHLKVIAIDVL